MRRRLAPFAAAVALTLGATGTLATPASAVTPGTPGTVIAEALDWLGTQQQADGGFEVAQFVGFETPDAVLAIAVGGQTGNTEWDHAEARAAVLAATTPDSKNPLDALDDLVDVPASSPAQAAKVVALDVIPLDLDPADFDPSADTAPPVDLIARITAAAGPGQDYATTAFNGRLFIAWALAAAGQPVPAPLIAAIKGAQQSNGGWNFSGDPRETGVDPDTTALAVVALAATGLTPSDPAIRKALVALGRTQVWNGSWGTPFDATNPNSTALVTLAVHATGGAVQNPCWRVAQDARFAGVPLPSPLVYLAGQQADDGHIASSGDSFGVNTFATSQTIQALGANSGAWPYAVASRPPTCAAQPANDRLVQAHYFDLLGRLADVGGRDGWVARLEAGASPERVARGIVATGEHGRSVVAELTSRYLGRVPSPTELSTWGPLVLRGRRLDVAAAMLGSGEYFAATGGDTEAWVDAAYLAVLGRPADSGGRAWAIGLLDSGTSRQAVARKLLRSSEGVTAEVRRAYQEILRREPDAGGRVYWRDRILGGTNPETVLAVMAGAPGYVARTR